MIIKVILRNARCNKDDLCFLFNVINIIRNFFNVNYLNPSILFGEMIFVYCEHLGSTWEQIQSVSGHGLLFTIWNG